MMHLTKKLKYAVFIIFVVLAEQIFAKYIAFGNAVPSLTFCAVLCTAMTEEEFSYTAVSAAVCGILCDILSAHGIGTYMLTYTAAAAVVYELRNKLFSSKLLFLICASFILSFMFQLIYFLLHIRDIGADSFFAVMVSPILISAVYNTVVCVLIFPIVGRIMEKRR